MLPWHQQPGSQFADQACFSQCPVRPAAAQALLLVAQMLTVDGLAATFSKVLGKPVRAPATFLQ